MTPSARVANSTAVGVVAVAAEVVLVGNVVVPGDGLVVVVPGDVVVVVVVG